MRKLVLMPAQMQGDSNMSVRHVHTHTHMYALCKEEIGKERVGGGDRRTFFQSKLKIAIGDVCTFSSLLV